VPNESFWLEALLRLLANNLLSLFIFDLRLFLPIDARLFCDSPDVFHPDLRAREHPAVFTSVGPARSQGIEICVPACDIGAVRLVRRIRCPTKHFSFCGVNRRVSKPRAGKAARAGKRRVCGFFQSSRSLRVRHETVPSCCACGDGWGPAMGGWTPALVCASLALFIAAGVCEVGGGWLVWQSLREVRASHPSRPVPTKLFR
jgi:hypothetical protein